MNLNQYRLISKALNAEIEAALLKRNLKVHKIRATIDDRGGEVRLSVVARDLDAKDASGNATNPDRENFKMFAALVGLKPEQLDQVFSLGGETYRLIGMRPRGTKTMLLERLSDNSIRIATPDIVANAFAALERKRRAS